MKIVHDQASMASLTEEPVGSAIEIVTGIGIEGDATGIVSVVLPEHDQRRRIGRTKTIDPTTSMDLARFPQARLTVVPTRNTNVQCDSKPTTIASVIPTRTRLQSTSSKVKEHHKEGTRVSHVGGALAKAVPAHQGGHRTQPHGQTGRL